MSTMQKVSIPRAPSPDGWAEFLQQYGCGPVEFTGADNALDERHLSAVRPRPRRVPAPHRRAARKHRPGALRR
ncbi:MAG TPA: hypothetical protein VK395_09430 [Gemmataceae bacterium]|nr:hypothetical protein [Gemmataceae bacterium]